MTEKNGETEASTVETETTKSKEGDENDDDDVVGTIMTRLQEELERHLLLSPMPTLTITSPQTIESCRNLILRPKDVFICSYPKSGTTWTQHIVLSLLRSMANKNKSKTNRSGQTDNNNDNSNDDDTTTTLEYSHVSEYAPFFEVDQHWDHQQSEEEEEQQQHQSELLPSIQSQHEKLGRRVFNTHLRWDMLPGRLEKEGGKEEGSRSSSPSSSTGGRRGTAKFIYVVRSPLDVCVSFYHHLSNQQEGGYEGNFDTFFDDWIQGKIAFGSYIDHIMSFIPAFSSSQSKSTTTTTTTPAAADGSSNNNTDSSRHRDILLISYEELVNDLATNVRRISQFLDIDATDDELAELLPTFGFQHMKSDLDRFQPKSVTWKNDFQFLRKGQVGDSKHLVSESQHEVWKDAITKSKINVYLDTIKFEDPNNQRLLQSLFSF